MKTILMIHFQLQHPNGKRESWKSVGAGLPGVTEDDIRNGKPYIYPTEQAAKERANFLSDREVSWEGNRAQDRAGFSYSLKPVP